MTPNANKDVKQQELSYIADRNAESVTLKASLVFS